MNVSEQDLVYNRHQFIDKLGIMQKINLISHIRPSNDKRASDIAGMQLISKSPVGKQAGRERVEEWRIQQKRETEHAA